MLHKTYKEYKLIQSIYGERRAERSQVPLMNHIDEGIDILKAIGASDKAIRAFCLHPIFQDDCALCANRAFAAQQNPEILMLAMEYRNTANAYLSKRSIFALSDIKLSPLPEINQMLIADKIQNFKDFMFYHYDTHIHSRKLYSYFQNWFKRLDIPQNIFEILKNDSAQLPLKKIQQHYRPKSPQNLKKNFSPK